MEIQLMPEVKRIISDNNKINIDFELNILLDKDNYYNIKPAINFLKTKINVNYSNEMSGDYNLITKRLSDEELLHKSNEPINNQVIEQSYILDIKKRETIIYYTGDQGLNYAFLTFGQLLDQKLNWNFNSMKIIDYPSIKNRGLMLDVSRGKVPKLKTIYKIIDILYLYKMNIFQLYIEDAYFFTSHPKIGKKKRRLTEEDIIKINRYCKQRAIEFQPNLQTFSHSHGILRTPEYKDLSENDDLWTMAPLKDETYQLLNDLIKDLLKGYQSKTMHINMDEAYDIGTGYSKDICNEIGKEQVYLKHLDKVLDITKQYDINNALIWSDMFNKYPELLKELDESITPVYWDYSPNENYSNMRHYEDMEFWVAPGTSSWNSIFPRMKNAFSNINNIIDAGYKHGANGMLLTDWGDYGHMQSIGLSFPGYIYAAEKSWSLNELTYDDFLSRMEYFNFFTKDQLEL
ncbi:MAG: beta-N-acetylhexosaminidase, partial [Halarsenatibacteraceae bacterium]